MAPVGERDLGRETPGGYYRLAEPISDMAVEGTGDRNEEPLPDVDLPLLRECAGEQNCIGERRKKTGAIEHQANIEAASGRRQRAQAPRIVAPVMTYRRVKGLNRN